MSAFLTACLVEDDVIKFEILKRKDILPKSLAFNWKEEAERFTPHLRVLEHTGMARDGNDFAACDVILTTPMVREFVTPV